VGSGVIGVKVAVGGKVTVTVEVTITCVCGEAEVQATKIIARMGKRIFFMVVSSL
jgi:hypothetical protein